MKKNSYDQENKGISHLDLERIDIQIQLYKTLPTYKRTVSTALLVVKRRCSCHSIKPFDWNER